MNEEKRDFSFDLNNAELEKKIEKLNEMIQKNVNMQPLINNSIKLEEMITLGLMKGTRKTGPVKKMLHAPTLKLYAVKVFFIRNSLKI